MDLQLTDKRALVTGSSGGIGEAIARGLADEGAIVVIHGRNEAQIERVAADVIGRGGRAVRASGDLATDEGAAHVVEQVTGALGGIDILVNNSGTYQNRGWEDAAPDGWRSLYEANVLSAVRLIRAFVPGMRQRGWGRIIQIGSGESTQPFAFMPDYAATKAALANLTVSLSKELAGSGITVNTVSPGIIVTAAVEAFYRQTARERGWGTDWQDIEAAVLREILPNAVGRLGRPDDVSGLVSFVASPRAAYVTGANLRVDGGSTITVN